MPTRFGGIRMAAVSGIVLFCLPVCATQAQIPKPITLSTEQQDELRSLASRILQHTDKAGCKIGSCTVLVVNFAGPAGATTHLGMQLADALSNQLSAQANGIQIVSRETFQQYIEKERIASKLLKDDNAARWLAMENGATTVLNGYLRGDANQKYLRVQLLDTRDFGKKEGKAKVTADDATFNDLGYPGDLDPMEPFVAQQAFLKSSREHADSSVVKVGPGVSVPRCTYTPDPSYTNPARKVEEQGIVILNAVISKDGLITHAQVLNGLPFGLNESAIKTILTWRCKPAVMEDSPVSIQIPIEISFRLY